MLGASVGRRRLVTVDHVELGPYGAQQDGAGDQRDLAHHEPVAEPQDFMVTVRVLADIPEKDRPKVRVVDTRGAWFKTEIARVRTAKGADFSACDIDIPVEVK